MRRATASILGALILASAAANCTIPELTSQGGECPCTDDYVCDDADGPNHGRCHRRGSASTSSSSSGAPGTGGSPSTGGSSAGGTGGSGGTGNGDGGVRDCGGADHWENTDPAFWDSTATCDGRDPTRCDVYTLTGHALLCCPDKADKSKGIVVTAYSGPSTDDPVGAVTTNFSWFVCWLRNEKVGESDVWFYTELDQGANWGFVPASGLKPPANPQFNPDDPDAMRLPTCFCPP